MADQSYGGIIWTNHVLERLGQRGLSQELAFGTFRHPDEQLVGKKYGTTEYHKRVNNSLITVIATQNEKKEWIVLSCWIDPPLYGTEDYRKKEAYTQYKKAGFWGKMWYTLKKQLGF